MNDSKISVRYAKALLQTAAEKNLEEQVNGDMALLLDCLNQESDFKALLDSPVVSPSDKVKVFNGVFKGKFSDLTVSFFELLVKNKRENFLKIICMNYLGFYARCKNIKKVVITSAQKLGGDTAEKIALIVKNQDNTSTVELTEKTDEKIIGGLIIQIDDTVYDASIRTQLKKIKEKLK